MTNGATDDYEQVFAHNLVVLVIWEVLYDVVENERNSSAELSKLGREPIWPGSANDIRNYGTRRILHALGVTEGNLTSPGAAEAQPVKGVSLKRQARAKRYVQAFHNAVHT